MHISGDKILGIRHPVGPSDLATDYYLRKTLFDFPVNDIGPNDSFAIYDAPYARWKLSSYCGIGKQIFYGPELTGLATGGGLFLLGCDVNPKLQASTDGLHWVVRTVPPAVGSRHAYYLDYFEHVGLYTCSLSLSGDVATSTDTIVWTARTSRKTSSGYNILYGNNIFWYVPGNLNYIVTSTDLIVWTERFQNLGGGNCESAAFGQGKWVIPGINYVTTDLISWSRRTFGSTYNPPSGSMCRYLPWLDAFFVYDNSYLQGYYGSPPIFMTTDTIVWEVHGISDTFWNGYPNGRDAIWNYHNAVRVINSVHDGGPQIAILGRQNSMFTSTDLISWKRRTFLPSTSAYDLRYPVGWGGGGRYLNNISYEYQNSYLRGIVSGDPRYGQNCLLVHGGTNHSGEQANNLYYTSLGGYRWVKSTYIPQLNSSRDENTAFSCQGVAEWNHPGFYEFLIPKGSRKMRMELLGGGGGGQSGSITQGGSGGEAGHYAVFDLDSRNFSETDTLYVSVGRGGWGGLGTGLVRSTDSVNWENVFNPFNAIGYSARSIAYSPIADEKYVATQDRSGVILRVYSSTDALSWTLRSATSSSLDVAYYSSLGSYMMVGESGYCSVSTDAIVWTLRTIGQTTGIFAQKYASPLGLYLIAGGTGGTCATSTDTIHWTSRTPMGMSNGSRVVRKYHIDYDPTSSLWMAVSDNYYIVKSTDAIVWTNSFTSRQASSYSSIAYWNGAWYADANYGFTLPFKMMLSSTDGIIWSDISSTFYTGIGGPTKTIFYERGTISGSLYLYPNQINGNLDVYVFTEDMTQSLMTTTDAINFVSLNDASHYGFRNSPIWDNTHYWYPISFGTQGGSDSSYTSGGFGVPTRIYWDDSSSNYATFESINNITADGGTSGGSTSTRTFDLTGYNRENIDLIYDNISTGRTPGKSSLLGDGSVSEVSVTSAGMRPTAGGGGANGVGNGGDVNIRGFGTYYKVNGGKYDSNTNGENGLDPRYLMNFFGSGGGGGGANSSGPDLWAPAVGPGSGYQFNYPSWNIDTNGYNWVTAHNNGNVFITTDFISWTARTSQVGWYYQVSKLGLYDPSYQFGNAVSLLVYSNSLGLWIGQNQSAVLTSTDALVWQVRTFGVGTQASWRAILKDAGGLQWIVGQTGIRNSTDGIVWTAVNAGSSNDWVSIAWSGQLYFAARYFATVMASTDGISWYQSLSLGNGPYIYALTAKSVNNYATEVSCIAAPYGGWTTYNRYYRNGSWSTLTTGIGGNDNSSNATNAWVDPVDGLWYITSFNNHAYSTDAISWISRTHTGGRPVNRIFTAGSEKIRFMSDAVVYRSSAIDTLVSLPGNGGSATTGGGGGGGGAGGSVKYAARGAGGRGGNGRAKITWW